MTPDLLEEGARRVATHRAPLTGLNNTESGGRNASTGRITTPGEVLTRTFVASSLAN